MKPKVIPNHNNAGGMGAAVAWAKKGNGTVSAKYKLNSVIRINGERRKIEAEVLAKFAVTAQSQSFTLISS